MNKISVFGATGFIGNRFCELFPDNVTKVPRDYVASATPELLWLISTTDNYHVFDDVKIDIETNLDLFVEALDWNFRQYGTDLVFNLISTWFVYGDVPVPVGERYFCNPNGWYSITALAREQLLRSYCDTFGCKYRIMRLGNVLGVGDKKASKKKNALQYFVQEIVNNRPVELYWPDRTVRDYIYVDDVCNAINLILSSEFTKNQIYNVGNGIPIKFGECVEYVVNQVGNDVVLHVERSNFHKVVQTNVIYLNNDKIVQLGYRPTKNIWAILDELIEHYTREKNG